MSNYDANPVGFLYERYQSSGVSPLYEVEMAHGQAHAPIFQVCSSSRVTILDLLFFCEVCAGCA